MKLCISKQPHITSHRANIPNMADKATTHDEALEKGDSFVKKPTKGQKAKAHCKKWWWVHVIVFIIVVLVVVLPVFVPSQSSSHLFTVLTSPAASTSDTPISPAMVSQNQNWCPPWKPSSTQLRTLLISNWTLLSSATQNSILPWTPSMALSTWMVAKHPLPTLMFRRSRQRMELSHTLSRES